MYANSAYGVFAGAEQIPLAASLEDAQRKNGFLGRKGHDRWKLEEVAPPLNAPVRESLATMKLLRDFSPLFLASPRKTVFVSLSTAVE